MYAMANCRVSILRGTTTDEFGDLADAGEFTPVLVGQPAQVVEVSQFTTDPATQTPRSVRRIEARISSRVGVRESDRLRVEGNGRIYTVQEITRPDPLGFTPDLELVLRRVD